MCFCIRDTWCYVLLLTSFQINFKYKKARCKSPNHLATIVFSKLKIYRLNFSIKWHLALWWHIHIHLHVLNMIVLLP